MKRARGATLAEIMAATKWQAHTVRGFASILGSKGGETIDSPKNAARAFKPLQQLAQILDAPGEPVQLGDDDRHERQKPFHAWAL